MSQKGQDGVVVGLTRQCCWTFLGFGPFAIDKWLSTALVGFPMLFTHLTVFTFVWFDLEHCVAYNSLVYFVGS